MRWEDEPWIKLYTRETPTTASWEWQARAIWPQIMTRLDGAGLMHVGAKGVKALAALIRFPVDVVRAGLDELQADGTVTLSPEGVLCAPNFVDAQRARTSDKLRKATQRERDRDAAVANHANLADVVSHGVTASHTASHGVTNRREEKREEEKRLEEKDSDSTAAGGLEQPDPPSVDAKTRRSRQEPSAQAKACAEHLLGAIRSHTPDYEGNPTAWAHDLDLAIRIDGRTPEQLNKASDWAHRNPQGAFWRANLLSGRKLRVHFERLRIQAREQQGLMGGALPGYKPRGLTGDDLRAAAAEMRAEEARRADGED